MRCTIVKCLLIKKKNSVQVKAIYKEIRHKAVCFCVCVFNEMLFPLNFQLHEAAVSFDGLEFVIVPIPIVQCVCKVKWSIKCWTNMCTFIENPTFCIFTELRSVCKRRLST